MEKTTIWNSVRQMHQASRTPTASDLEFMCKRLVAHLEPPRIRKALPARATCGEQLRIGIDGFPLPDVDLFDGELRARRGPAGMPIASFQGLNGPALAEATYRSRTREVVVTVPELATSGPVILLFPYRMVFGKGVLRAAENGDGSPFGPCPADTPPIRPEDRVHQYPVIAGQLVVSCQRCFTGDPICPLGAIKYNADWDICEVDWDICKGQYVTPELVFVNGQWVVIRGSENSCWECFQGEESRSVKCRHRALKRVAHIPESTPTLDCCGCCTDIKQAIPGMCVRQLCVFGAVSGGHACTSCTGQNDTGDGSWGGGYRIDSAKCIGCGICYRNISCSELSMKAFIQPQFLCALRLDSIEFHWRPGAPQLIGFPGPLFLGVFGRGEQGPIFDEMELDPSITERPLSIGHGYRFIENLRFAIYHKQGGTRVPALGPAGLGGFGGGVQPMVSTAIGCWESGLNVPGSLDIAAWPYGTFRIHFSPGLAAAIPWAAAVSAEHRSAPGSLLATRQS